MYRCISQMYPQPFLEIFGFTNLQLFIHKLYEQFYATLCAHIFYFVVHVFKIET